MTSPKRDLKDFAAFILTHGRPDNVKTYRTLRRQGYSGKIFIIIDDLDSTRKQYEEKFGPEVVVFGKRAIAKKFDQGDNFNDMRAIFYARNACFEIAKKLGVKHFVQLDDDYNSFEYRFGPALTYQYKNAKNMDQVFTAVLKFYKRSRCHSIALAQGGDFIGGDQGTMAEILTLKRKCMNSFFCSTERPFPFVGRVNEDVNTYTNLATRGHLFFTTNHVSLIQTMTQTNKGGMTELYVDSGTYVKSFYSVMYHPSGVKIRLLHTKNARLHHSVDWNATAPKILRETLKKKR